MGKSNKKNNGVNIEVVRYDQQYTIYGFFLLILLLAFSPLFSFLAVSGIVLCAGRSLSSYERIFLNLILIFSIVVIAASANYNGVSSSSDFANVYWPEYYNIINKPFFEDNFSKNGEYLLSFILKVATILNGEALTQKGLYFIVLTISFLLFYVFLEFYAFKEESKKFKALGILISIIMFACLIPLQYMRQIFALIFVLFSLYSIYFNKKLMALVYFLIAMLSHQSSFLILFILYVYMINNNKYIKILLLSFFVIIGLFFTNLSQILLNFNISSEISKKSEYYQSDFTDKNTGSLRVVLLIIFYILFRFFSKRDVLSEKLKSLCFYSFLSFIAIYNVPEMPIRFFGILVFILPGYLFFNSTSGLLNKNNNYFFYSIFVFFLCLIILCQYAFFSDYENMLGTPLDFQGLWYSYGKIGSRPFYYF